MEVVNKYHKFEAKRQNDKQSIEHATSIPKWADEKDVDTHAEEARKWAVKILQTISDLTKNVGPARDEGQLLPFFEVQYRTLLLTYDNKDSIHDLCSVLLQKLAPNVFFSQEDSD